MKYHPKIHFWKVDEERALGFVCINVFEFKSEEFSLQTEIKNGLLFEGYFWREITLNQVDESIYGSINLDKLVESDWIYVDSIQLEKQFQKLWSETDWGKDLHVFRHFYSESKEFFDRIDFKSDKHYFLNKDWIDKTKTIEFDFFTYLTIVISIGENAIAVTTFGED